MSKEYEPRPFKEKVIWWAKYGGIVAGILGIIAQSANLAIGGAMVSAGGFVGESYIRKRQNKS